MVSFELAIPPEAIVTLDGFIVAVGGAPTALEVDDTVVEKETLPVNRLNVFTVMSEFADWLDRTARLLGLALSSKSEDVFEILHAVTGCISHPEKL